MTIITLCAISLIIYSNVIYFTLHIISTDILLNWKKKILSNIIDFNYIEKYTYCIMIKTKRISDIEMSSSYRLHSTVRLINENLLRVCKKSVNTNRVILIKKKIIQLCILVSFCLIQRKWTRFIIFKFSANILYV